jgi:hypothetical protein
VSLLNTRGSDATVKFAIANGRQLAWVTRDDPNLPWDASDVWLADLIDAGSDVYLGRSTRSLAA